jgi:uncharacterized protein (TIGR03435 family)
MRTLVLLALATAAAAQPAFDVASIKPAEPLIPGRSVGNRVLADRVDYTSATLRYCIGFAYGVKDYQISGPSSLNDRWQILAKAPEGATRDQLPAMMQALLAERFHLQIHREKKDFDGLAMVVGKDGPKLKRGEALANFRTSLRVGGGGKIETQGMTMPMLATLLTQTLARPVADVTGLPDAYAFTVEYAAYEAIGGMKFTVTGGDALPQLAHDVDPGTSVFNSIQKLGLKLEPRKVSLEVIVVDRADKTPVAN